MINKKFAIDALERGLSTAAQSVLLAVGGDSLNVLSADWKVYAGAAGGGFLLSLLKSVAARGVGDPDSASLAPEVEA